MPSHLRDSTIPKSYLIYLVGALFLVNVLNYMDRMALAILMPLVSRDLKLTDTQSGLLVGAAFFICYAVCAVPLARWSDRGIRRDIIAYCVTVWSIMTALCGAASNFIQLALARIGVSVGEAGSFPASSSMICDSFPVRLRPAIFALLSFGTYLGITVGMGVAGWLGDELGWRWTFVILGLPGIVVAMMIKLTLREPERGAFDPPGDGLGKPTFRHTVQTLLKTPVYVRLQFFFVANAFAYTSLVQWWPSFFARNSDLELSSIGAHLGTAIGLGSAAGTLLGGMLASRLADGGARSSLLISAIAAGSACPFAVASLFVPSVWTATVCIFCAVLLWSIPSGPTMAVVYSSVKADMRATGGALSIFILSVLGFGLGPSVVGILSDALSVRFGPDALRYALVTPALLFLVGGAALLTAVSATPNGFHKRNVAA